MAQTPAGSSTKRRAEAEQGQGQRRRPRRAPPVWLQLYVSCDEYGQDFILDVRPSATFCDIAAKLQNITSIPASSQDIRLMGSPPWVRPWSLGTLSDYNIGPGDYIHIELVRRG